MAVTSIAASKSAGRYDGRKSNTRQVPGGRAQINARLRTIQPVEAAVDDPWGGKDRILVTVNRRVDVLEMERSHDRISEAAYRTGQIVQALFERMGYAGLGGADMAGGSRVDPVLAIDKKILRLLESAVKVQALMHGISRHLGMIDTRLLRRVLGDRMTWAQCAAIEGKAGERGASYVAARFRDALEDLARAWTAKGRLHPFDDRYAEESSPASIAARRAASAEARAAAEPTVAP